MLTKVENAVFGLKLSEYHTGYRAYRREVLETVDYRFNLERFIFDEEIIAQIIHAGYRIAEVSVLRVNFPKHPAPVSGRVAGMVLEFSR